MPVNSLRLQVTAGPDGQPTVRAADPKPEAHSYRKPEQVRSADRQASVPLYRVAWRDKKRRRLYRAHLIVWKDAGGLRHREKYSDPKTARQRAREIADAKAAGRVDLLSLSRAESATVLRALDLARPTGKPLDTLVAEHIQITLDLGGHSPQELLAFWHRNHPATASGKTCPEILEELLAARRKDGLSERSLQNYRSRIGRFCHDFTGPISAVTSQDIDTWLAGLPVSRRTRNNYRGDLLPLWVFARRRNYLPRGWDPFDQVAVVKNETVVVEIFTPDDLLKLIRARQAIEQTEPFQRQGAKTLLPYLLIAAFAGCRHAEMSAPGQPVLDWRDVDLENAEIRVRPQVARKIGRDRIVPIAENLGLWLVPYARHNGPVCELSSTTGALVQTAAAAGIPWRHNGLRRSFISYRLAQTSNIEQTAHEAGTSPGRVRENYQKTVPKREAKRWFDLRPEEGQILRLPLFAWAARPSTTHG